MMELLTAENLVALATLTTLEIVLGIDNLVVIAILTAKLAPDQRARARRIGLVAAMAMRIALLLTLSWMMQLTGELFRVADLSTEHLHAPDFPVRIAEPARPGLKLLDAARAAER